METRCRIPLVLGGNCLFEITPLVLLVGAILVFPVAFVLDRVARAVGLTETSWLLSILYLVPVLAVTALGWAAWQATTTRKVTGHNLLAFLGGLAVTGLSGLVVYLAWGFRDF